VGEVRSVSVVKDTGKLILRNVVLSVTLNLKNLSITAKN